MASSTTAPRPALQRSWKEWALLGLLVAFWGSSFAFTKISVETFGPIWTTALRIAFAASILWGVCIATGRKLPGPALWGGICWLALTGVVAPFLLLGWGVQHIPSGLAGMIMAVTPLAVLAMAHVFLPDEKASLIKLLGVVIGFIGAVILIGPEKLWNIRSEGLAVWGELALFGSAMCYGIHSIATRRLPGIGLVERAAAVCIAGTAMTLPLAIWSGPAILSNAPPLAWGCVAALAIGPTALAFVIVYLLLERSGAGFVASVNYLIPVWAAMLGTVFLAEQLPLQVLIGFGVIIAGLGLSELGQTRKPPPRPAETLSP